MTDILDNMKKNYGISACLVGLFFLFVIMTVFWVNKSTFGIVADISSDIVINCPEKANPGEEIKCMISTNIDDINILSINANYQLSDGIKYISFGTECDDDICFEPLYDSSKGFAVGNTTGINKETLIGILTLVISEDAVANNKYDIGLSNIEFCDDEYNMTLIEDVTTSVTINSDDASLLDINVKYENEDGQFTNIEFNEEFNSEVYDYSVNVSKDISEVIIGYTKAVGSIVSGNVDIGRNVSLHYGTNKFELNVLSEDGNVENTYNISIYREYEFNTEVYQYYKVGEEHYIYTKNDSSEEIINSLEVLSNDLSYNITDDNKLEIKYANTDVLATINIIGFESEYSIIDKVVYIDSGLTYQKMLDKIVSDSVDIKIVDIKGNEINKETLVDESHKLNIYNEEGKLLDNYTFKIDYFEIDDSLVIDDGTKIIKRIPIGIKYSEFKELFNTTGEVIINSNDTLVTDMNDVVKTGDKLTIKLNNQSFVYTLSVLGDLTGDGKVKVNDVDRLYRGLKGRRELTDLEKSSGDIINNGSIKVNDVDKLYRYLKERITSLEAVK